MNRAGTVLLAGGLGGAHLAPALRDRLGANRLTVVVNVGDDFDWMGLRICPDLDTVTYALAGVWDRRRGWGRRRETFRMRGALGRFPAESWFGVGDLDLALHLARTGRLRAGRRLGAVTGDLARALGVRGVAIVPASEERGETKIVVARGRRLHFQEWYVRDGARPRVAAVRLSRAPASRAALDALGRAAAVVLAPSNPVSSIGTILALAGMEEAVRAVPRRIAVSPVALRRESEDEGIRHHARARRHLLAIEGRRDTPVSIAERYADLAHAFVLDRADRADAPAISRLGLEPITTDLLSAPALADAVARRR